MSIKFIGTGSVNGIEQYYGTRVVLSGSEIDLATGNYFIKTVTDTTTFTIANVPVTGTTSKFSLELIGAGYQINWFSGVIWENGFPPVLRDQSVIIEFITGDGGATWVGKILNRVGASPYWINLMGGAGGDYGYGIAVDSSGNVYVAGYTESQGAGGSDVLIAKYNTSGTLQWQRVLGGASNDFGYGIAVDSSGNVYVTGFTDSQGAGSGDIIIAKYNTSGTLQWQRVLGGASADSGYGVAVDSTGNVYIAGTTSSQGAGSGDIIIAKYNTSGTLQWQRTLGGAGYDEGVGIAVDSSGNVYITGYTDSQGAGNVDVLIAKYNTSGTLQWQRVLGGASADYGYAIAVDSSDNVYIAGYIESQGAGIEDVLIAKYNTSGTLQWQRTLGGANTDYGYGIAVDSSGNVYVNGQTFSQGAGSVDVLIAKYNTSGTLQWQRTLGGANNDYGYGIAVDSSGNVYVTGWTESQGAGSYDAFIAKLPGDGLGIGVYGNLTYQPSSLTSATSTLTSATSTLTSSTSTLTSSTSTLVDAPATLTSSVIYIKSEDFTR